MRALLLNTCGQEAVVGLGEDGAVGEERRFPGRQASEVLVGVVRELLGTSGWRLGDVGAVAVVSGPGSFTGVRVGLSAAKGFCEACGAGLVAVSRLELLAKGGGMAVLDAGRGEFYCRDGQGEALVEKEELMRRAGSAQLVTCEPAIARVLPEVKLVEEPGAGALLKVAMERARAGAWSDVAATDANYLRRTDAELLAKLKVRG